MKNSAWYHKLWRDKLGELPLKKDDTAAWADMRNLLDEQLPVGATSTGNSAYKLNAFIKTALVLVIAAIITTPFILRSNKNNKNSFKNSKNLPARTAVHNVPNKLSDQSSSEGLTIPDSAFHHSGSSAESLTQNQRNTADSSIIGNKSVTVNHNVQSLNQVGLKAKATQYQTNNNAENDNPINSASTLRDAKLSKYNAFKGRSKHADMMVTEGNQKNQHSLKSGHSTSTNYTSKHPEDNIAKSTLKTNANGTYTSLSNNIDGKIIISGNTTSGVAKSANANNDKEAADTKIDPVKSPANNTDVKEVKSPGTKSRAFNTSPKTVKTKENKAKSNTKKPKTDDLPPKYDYGLEAGYNAGQAHNLYAGIFGSYQVKSKWLIGIGLRLNTYRTISGEYSYQSYYSPDSIPPFKVTDSRKVMALTIPITLEYKLTKNISLKGGPVISMPIKQSGISTKLGAIPNIRDTVYHTQIIDSAFKKTTINKLNIGFTGGVSIQIKHFNIEAMYQVLTPYKISSGLGSYQKSNQSFQIGIGYRFR